MNALSEESLLPPLSALMPDQGENTNSELQNQEQDPKQLNAFSPLKNQKEQAFSPSFVSSPSSLSQAGSSTFSQEPFPLFQDILEELLQIESQLRSRGPFQELPNISHLFERLDQLESDGAFLTQEEKEQTEAHITCVRTLALNKTRKSPSRTFIQQQQLLEQQTLQCDAQLGMLLQGLLRGLDPLRNVL